MPGTGTTFTLETQLNQRQLARGRDLYPGQGQVGVFIPRGGFDWGDHRLPSFGQARHPGRQALSGQSLGRCEPSHPRVINTDKEAAYPPAIVQLKAKDALVENCQHRPVQYLNNVLEQDHRAIKRRVRASQHFRSFWGAWRTIAGYEAMHMIRKGQACWSAVGAKVGLLHRFILDLPRHQNPLILNALEGRSYAETGELLGKCRSGLVLDAYRAGCKGYVRRWLEFAP